MDAWSSECKFYCERSRFDHEVDQRVIRVFCKTVLSYTVEVVGIVPSIIWLLVSSFICVKILSVGKLLPSFRGVMTVSKNKLFKIIYILKGF